MKILALEFSADERTVAVLVDGVVRGLATEQATRHTRAFGMIEAALRQAELEREAIDLLAVGLGPGSYTGIRSALALAQGWQFALNTPVAGVSGAEALALQAARTGLAGKVNVVIDAQRGEFYAARYLIEDGTPRPDEALRLASAAEIQARSDAGEFLIGPGITKWFSVGRDLAPSAAVVAELAMRVERPATADRLEPIYLRETAFVKAPPARIIA